MDNIKIKEELLEEIRTKKSRVDAYHVLSEAFTLSHSDTKDVIIEAINSGVSFYVGTKGASDLEPMVFFLPANMAGEVLLRLMEKEPFINEGTFESIICLPRKIAKEVLLKYAKLYPLPEDVEPKIFNFPPNDAKEIYMEQIKHCSNGVCGEAEINIFTQPTTSVREILLDYIGRGFSLCDRAQVMIFDLPPEVAKELLFRYIQDRPLCEEAQIKIFDLPSEHAADVFSRYYEEWIFCAAALNVAKSHGLLT
jgi:hypothetical protein